MHRDFSFRDGERLIRFGVAVVDSAGPLLTSAGFEGYALLTTDRARAAAPALVDTAALVVSVPPGPVPDAAAAVRGGVGGRPLVALGGGRVIDAAKAIAAADGLACAAVPTTLSGAPFTPFHRLPAGARAPRLVRPSLVVADPGLMASQPIEGLVASAMNALAHAVEALYAPLANPVAEMAALRAATGFTRGFESAEPDRTELALAALLAGYAIGTTGFAIHHATCQTIVATLGTPHAETNTVVLPRSVAVMATRSPDVIGRLDLALGGEGRAEDASARVGSLARPAGIAWPRGARCRRGRDRRSSRSAPYPSRCRCYAACGAIGRRVACVSARGALAASSPNGWVEVSGRVRACQISPARSRRSPGLPRGSAPLPPARSPGRVRQWPSAPGARIA